MTDNELLTAYKWFNYRLDRLLEDKKYLMSQGITLDKCYDEVCTVYEVARDLITAEAKNKGLIDNPEG